MSVLPLLLCSVLGADGLAALRVALGELPARQPVRATLDYEFRNESGDEEKPEVVEGRASALLEDGPDGLRITWGRPLLRAAAAEARARASDPDASTPTRSAMLELGRTDLSESVDAGAALLRLLEKATLVEERPEDFEGRPAHLLLLRLEPVLSRRDRRYVKESEETARIWLGADGLPLAAERSRRVKGRAFLVISFEGSEREEIRYGRSEDRLLVTRRSREASSSGGGERGRQHSLATLHIEAGRGDPVGR